MHTGNGKTTFQRPDLPGSVVIASLHPAWLEFLRFCQTLQFGEIEKLRIQDGLPVLAEVTRQKVKFGS